MLISKVTIVELTPKNFCKWITEIKGHSEAAKIWKYMDLDLDISIPTVSNYLEVSDYYIIVAAMTATDTPTRVPATDYEDLNKMQRSSYRFKLETYKHREREAAKIKAEVQKIRTIVLESARIHIPDTKFSVSARELLKALQTRFKRDDDTLIEQIHDKYKELKEKAPTKDKIELWIA